MGHDKTIMIVYKHDIGVTQQVVTSFQLSDICC